MNKKGGIYAQPLNMPLIRKSSYRGQTPTTAPALDITMVSAPSLLFIFVCLMGHIIREGGQTFVKPFERKSALDENISTPQNPFKNFIYPRPNKNYPGHVSGYL